MTAVRNDYGYERIFQRHVEALGTKGDALVGLATSGASQNVCAALQTARQIGAFTVAFTGRGGGEIAAIVYVALRIPSQDTARIRQVMFCGHMI